MTMPKIYTGAEARALRDAATPGEYDVQRIDESDGGFRWELSVVDASKLFKQRTIVIAGSTQSDLDSKRARYDAALWAAAPDLARSVVHWHERATTAEAERAQAVDSQARLARMTDEAMNERDTLRAEVAGLRAALDFYANADNYHAITIFGAPPCGAFIDDMSDDHESPNHYQKMPGRQARAALAEHGGKADG